MQLPLAHFLFAGRLQLQHPRERRYKRFRILRSILFIPRHAAAQQKRHALRKGAVFVGDHPRALRRGVCHLQNILFRNLCDEGQRLFAQRSVLLRHAQQHRLYVHIQKQLHVARADLLPVTALNDAFTNLLQTRILGLCLLNHCFHVRILR